MFDSVFDSAESILDKQSVRRNTVSGSDFSLEVLGLGSIHGEGDVGIASCVETGDVVKSADFDFSGVPEISVVPEAAGDLEVPFSEFNLASNCVLESHMIS